MTDAVTVSDEAIGVISRALEAAYTRGVEWNEENPLDREYRFKAARDFADKSLNAPDSDLGRWVNALLNQPTPEPAAWLHPEAGWSNVDRSFVAMHCRHDGPQPIPLFASPTSPTEVKALREALKPFAEFAENVDEHGWTSSIHEESISTWFGPSDFRAALLASNEVGKCGPEAKFAALAVPIGVLLTAVYFVGKHFGWWT